MSSFDFPENNFTNVYIIKPSAIPFGIENEKGIRIAVKYAGILFEGSFFLNPLINETILIPLTINIEDTAAKGIKDNSGEKKNNAISNNATTNEVIPVFPPDWIPDIPSILVVTKGTPNKFPIIVPMESEINNFFMPFTSILFCLFGSEDNAIILLVVVKKSIIKKEKISCGKPNAPIKSKFKMVGIITSGIVKNDPPKVVFPITQDKKAIIKDDQIYANLFFFDIKIISINIPKNVRSAVGSSKFPRYKNELLLDTNIPDILKPTITKNRPIPVQIPFFIVRGMAFNI